MFIPTTLVAVVGSVLIPLNSGLVFVSWKKFGVGTEVRLNPFEFRAGICLQ